MKAIARQAVVALAWAAVSITVIYLVSANLVLNTDLLDPVINSKRERLQVEWQSGYTFFPGRVHVDGLWIRGQSASLQWETRLEQGDFVLRLLPLFRKELRVESGRGSGFGFAARPRFDHATSPPGAELRAAHYPLIEGFDNPPRLVPEEIYPARSVPPKNPWDLEVRDVVLAGAVDLWFGEMRLAGFGEIGGDFLYEISRDMEVPGMRLALDPAEFSWAGELLVENADFDLEGALGSFRLDETRGPELLSQLHGSVRIVDGELNNLQALDAFVPGSSAFAVVRGRGRVNLDLAAGPEAGTRGSIRLEVSDVAANLASGPMTGEFLLDAELSDGELAEGRFRVVGEVRFDRVLWPKEAERLKQRGEKATDDDLWWANLSLEGGWFDLGQPSSIDSPLSVSMNNTRPVLRAFAVSSDEEDAALPGWLRHLPNVPNLKGEARLLLTETSHRLDGVRIDGDGLSLRSEMRGTADGSVGALYIKFKGIGAAIGTQDGKSSIHLFRPRRWYLGRLQEMGIVRQPFEDEE